MATMIAEAQDKIRALAGDRLVGWHVEFETREPFGNRSGIVRQVTVNGDILSVDFGGDSPMSFNFAWEPPYYSEYPDGTIVASSGFNIGIGFKFTPPRKAGNNRSAGGQRTVRT